MVNDFDAYQKEAERTGNAGTLEERACNYAMGLVGEAGEACDLLKKWVFHEHPRDIDKLTKELGDVLWYVAMLCSTYGIPLSTVASQNVAKLRARYPDGFSVQASRTRADIATANEPESGLHCVSEFGCNTQGACAIQGRCLMGDIND